LRSFDYEVETGYDVGVQAANSAHKTATASVQIKISDVDDKPSFKEKNYDVSVQENSSPGTSVLTTAKRGFVFEDEDSKPEQYVCTLEEVTSSYVLDHFRFNRVKSECYLVTTKQLSYTKETQFQFKVTATNKDVQNMHTTCSVVLKVIDINNYGPVFTQSDYWVTVSSLTPVDTSILTVDAPDLDSDVNGQVSYHILAANNNDDKRYLIYIRFSFIIYL
jgi:hypothetical protein